MHKNRTIFFLLTFVLLTVPKMSAFAEADISIIREYEIKAAFIYNFAKFVEWPKEKFRDDEAPLVLGIIGEDPFGSSADALLGKTIRGRQLMIKRSKNQSNLNPCHMIFISKSETTKLKQIIEELKNLPILTISDIQDFHKAGGHINFVIHQNKIRFIVNARAAKHADLEISSRLLKLSMIKATD